MWRLSYIYGLSWLLTLSRFKAQELNEAKHIHDLVQPSFINRPGDIPCDPEVATSSGLLHGTRNDNAQSFFDIPFAVPPTGKQRFQPPEMLNDKDAERWLPAKGRIHCSSTYGKGTENCLILNVHVPLHVPLTDAASPPSERLPVLLFIHGGAFIFGSANKEAHESRFLSERLNAVVVATNYRLGPLGFLVFDDGKNVIDGNQGLKDQRLAMEWVQKNIENFGGDKSKVFIFGESAGGQSVLFHLLSRKSEPLFKQAQIQSNPALYRYPTRKEALEVTEKLVELLRCDTDSSSRDCCSSDKESYTCLMDASTESLQKATRSITQDDVDALNLLDAVEPFRPYIDEDEFNDQPLALVKDGLWNTHKPFIVGVNEEELNPLEKWFQFNRSVYRHLNVLLFKEHGRDIADKYEKKYPEHEDYLELFEQEVTDMVFRCPSRSLAREESTKSLLEGAQAIMQDYVTRLDLLDEVEPFCPNTDEAEFKDQPLALVKDGLWNKNKPFKFERLIYRLLNVLLFKELGKDIADKYEETYPEKDYLELLAQEATDIVFRCPSRSLARLASKKSEQSVYFYTYDHAINGENCDHLRFQIFCGYSCHASELPFVFRTLEHIGMKPDVDDMSVMNQWSIYMKNFALKGSPSGDAQESFPDWPPYTEETKYLSIRIMSTKPETEENVTKEVCDLLDRTGLYPTLTSP